MLVYDIKVLDIHTLRVNNMHMVGKQIKELRERQGLTQAALAEKVGIERSTVTRIEAGSMNPTVGILTRIATALGASVEILLTVCD